MQNMKLTHNLFHVNLHHQVRTAATLDGDTTAAAAEQDITALAGFPPMIRSTLSKRFRACFHAWQRWSFKKSLWTISKEKKTSLMIYL